MKIIHGRSRGPLYKAYSEAPLDALPGSDLQFAVGVVAVDLNTGTGIGTICTILCANHSTGAQIIRIGRNPAFGPPASGISLLPNEEVTIEFYTGDAAQSLHAICDIPGGLLDVIKMYQFVT